MKNTDELVVGISSIDGYTHDNAAVILNKGKILFASLEERYSRLKHDGSFPKLSLKAGLNYTKHNLSEVKTIAVGYPKRRPLTVITNKYFYELINLFLSIAIYRNILLLKDAYSILKLLYKKSVPGVINKSIENKKIVYVDHHLAHAASAYYTSGFNKSISLVLDAFGSTDNGEIRAGAVFLCDGEEIKEVMSIPIYSSLGLFYQSVTYSLGFTPGDGEGKTMGFAAYGKPNNTLKKLIDFAPHFADGRWYPGKDWLAGILPCIPKAAHLFKATRFGRRLDQLIKEHSGKDVAAGAQKILEYEVISLMNYLILKYPQYQNVCLSGGIFLNVKTNKRIMELKKVTNIFVHPNPGDGGVALGAAFVATDKRYLKSISGLGLDTAGLGESFSDNLILQQLKLYKGKIAYQKKEDIVGYTSKQLKEGKVIGWFQGRAEWGPRALGFRSVLADPRKIEVKERINHVLKNREWFMPFAPSVLEEEGDKYFKRFRYTPFMTLVFDIISPKEKLIPAAIHIDNTARVNSVNMKNNPNYYKLLKSFYKLTGLPILLNTSFNRHGLPIVNSPKDAVDHLLMGAVDELIIGNYSVRKL